jgi:hypothetical protein
VPIALPNHLRPRREKIFGPAPEHRLDGNAKARVWAAAAAYNAKNRCPRQHWGPLTRATMDVLKALLWRFHGADGGGRCFPSFERIAAAAKCHRDTVCEAIKALEVAELLTWVTASGLDRPGTEETSTMFSCSRLLRLIAMQTYERPTGSPEARSRTAAAAWMPPLPRKACSICSFVKRRFHPTSRALAVHKVQEVCTILARKLTQIGVTFHVPRRRSASLQRSATAPPGKRQVELPAILEGRRVGIPPFPFMDQHILGAE